MRKLLYLPILLFLISCGGKGVEGQVGQIISIAAEENLEETNVDYNWIIMGQPDGSLLSPKDLKYKNNGQEMIFTPDYPGDYNFEVSVTKFGDELSSQSFFFTISDFTEAEEEEIEDETAKEEEWLKESLDDYDEEEEIVDRWFRDIVGNILDDEGLDKDRGSGYINVVPISKGKSEIS